MESSSTISSSISDGSNGSIILRKKQTVRIENPFTFKVFQVFTGVGVGCGLGIGVGSPLNLGAIPMLGQVMSAAGGATHAFSGIGRHVNDSLKKMGAKSIQAGVGCGVGVGHGFGVGLAVKPGVVHQIQSCAIQAVSKMMMKFGGTPNLSIDQASLSNLPSSLQSGMSMLDASSAQNPMQNITNLTKQVQDVKTQDLPGNINSSVGSVYENSSSQGASLHSTFGVASENPINGLMQKPNFGEGSNLNDTVDQLRSENRVLQMVMKHQQVIDELLEENEKLRHVLVEDLKVSPSKLQPKNQLGRYTSPCADCFECRRKEKKR